MTYQKPQSVYQAAILLDELQPGWEKKINVEQLNMVSSCYCILGQLNNGNHSTWKYFNTLYDMDGPFSYYARSTEWIKEINNRLEKKINKPQTVKEAAILLDELVCGVRTGDIVSYYCNTSRQHQEGIVLDLGHKKILISKDDYFEINSDSTILDSGQIGWGRVLEKIVRPITNHDYACFIRNQKPVKYNVIFEKKKTHKITIDGIEKEISEESYQELKKNLL